jgi:hypothetical protein
MSAYTHEKGRLIGCINFARRQLAKECGSMVDFINSSGSSAKINTFVSQAKRASIRTASELQDYTSKALSLLPATKMLTPQMQKFVGEARRCLKDVKSGLGDVCSETNLSYIKSTTNQINQALTQIAKLTAISERKIATEIIEESLRNLGYSTKVAEGNNNSAIEARKGHEVRLIAVGDGMLITRDVAGLGDSSCLASNAAIREECKRKGLALEVQEDKRHDDLDGGSLISLAGRQRASNLAEGYIASLTNAANPYMVTSGGIYSTEESTTGSLTRWEKV